jgi:hypothetical protein
MHVLDFGRIMNLPIRNGEPVLDPWPSTIKDIKFPSEPSPVVDANDFVLKRQAAEFFAYTRGVRSGTIRVLEIRHGLPFKMEVEDANPNVCRG